jgi:hypothetical protein
MAEIVAAVVTVVGVIVGPVVLAYFKRRLDAIDRVAAETAKVSAVTHELVNSNMTKALDGELDARTRELATLRELIELRTALGQKPTPSTLETIVATETEIARLQTTITDRG